MKVHVTVDENIYPELHALMEITPISKRARVLANLAYKACLLTNAALLMNTETATPLKGRGSGVKKKSDKPKPHKVLSQPMVKTEEHKNDGLNIISEQQNYFGDSSSGFSSDNSNTVISVSDIRDDSISGQQDNAAGEGSGALAVKRKRRILE